MNRMLIAAPFIALVLNGCAVSPGYNGGVMIAPALPVVVELGTDPYYYHGGYYYHYDNNNWRYSSSRTGTYTELPRDRYPKETRYKGRDDRRGDQRSDDRGNQDNKGRGNQDNKGRGNN